jgi:hypothetical protein
MAATHGATKPKRRCASSARSKARRIARTTREAAQAKAATRRPRRERASIRIGFPAQHLQKPGSEADLELAPQFMAPDYRGSGKLEGLAAIVTGADSGIGRAVAVLFAREGADVTVAYLEEREDAAETRRWRRRRT